MNTQYIVCIGECCRGNKNGMEADGNTRPRVHFAPPRPGYAPPVTAYGSPPCQGLRLPLRAYTPHGPAVGVCCRCMLSSWGKLGENARKLGKAGPPGILNMHQGIRLTIANWYMFSIWMVCIFWGGGNIRMTPPPDFPSKTHGPV